MTLKKQKKIDRFNLFMKDAEELIEYWSYTSQYKLTASYNYVEIYRDIERLIWGKYY